MIPPIIIYRAYGPGSSARMLLPIKPYFDYMEGYEKLLRCARCQEDRTVYVRYGDNPKIVATDESEEEGRITTLETSFEHIVCYDCFEKAIYPKLFEMPFPEQYLIYLDGHTVRTMEGENDR